MHLHRQEDTRNMGVHEDTTQYHCSQFELLSASASWEDPGCSNELAEL